MKKTYLILLTLSSLSLSPQAFAEDSDSTSHFTSAQKEEIKKIVEEFLSENTGVVVAAMDAEMAKKKQEEIEKLKKAVAHHKEKIFHNPHLPVAGNAKGEKSLVIFADPYCGYCRKLHKELPAVMEANKDLKVIFVDIPIMGEQSTTAIKAMIAAHNQGKYEPFQKLILTSKGPLTHKKLVKKAKSVGIDVKKFEADLKSKETQEKVDKTLALAEEIGIHATPVIIINETDVTPGYIPAEEINEMLVMPVTTAKQ